MNESIFQTLMSNVHISPPRTFCRCLLTILQLGKVKLRVMRMWPRLQENFQLFLPIPNLGNKKLTHFSLSTMIFFSQYNREGRLKLFKTWKLMKYEEIMCWEPVPSSQHSIEPETDGALLWVCNLSLAAGLGVHRGERWLLVKSCRWKPGSSWVWAHAFSSLVQIKLPNFAPGEAEGF